MAKVGIVEMLSPQSTRNTTSFSKTTTNSGFKEQKKIEIFIKCNELIQMDKFSYSDPLCVLEVKKLGQWTEYGRTESLPNNLNPTFVESFIIDNCSAQYPRLRFSLYDLANFTSKDLRKHDFIGSVELDFDTLLTSESPLVRTLRIPGDIKPRGFINIFYEEVIASKTNVRLQIRGLGLEKKSLLSKCDAFFEVERILDSGHFHPVYRSEMVARNVDPKWAPLDIYLQKLCNEDVTKEARITCWHFSNSGSHTVIGQCSFIVNDVLQRKVKSMSLNKPPKPGKSTKRTTSKGTLQIVHCHADRYFSLLDYIQGGCQIKMTCTVDFTLSNGDPTLPNSLHSKTPEQNEYIHTIEAMAPIITHYDPQKKIPFFGFGAKNDTGLYCFAVNGDEKLPEVDGVESLIETYFNLLSTIKLGGPTYLAPVIERIAEYAQNKISQESQYYVVALVIMDGVTNDVDDTIDKLVEYGALPLSIIIAGVGPADFGCMEELFNSRRKPLRSRDGQELNRQITHFVELGKHSRARHMSAAREALAHVSTQIVAYFKSNNIIPNPPQKSIEEIAWGESTVMNGFGHKSRPVSPLTRKRAVSLNPRCPTCGSVLMNNNTLHI